MAIRVLLAVSIALLGLPSSSAADGDCTRAEQIAGVCSEIDETTVKLVGEEVIPGQPPGQAPAPGGAPNGAPGGTTAPRPILSGAQWCQLVNQFAADACVGSPEAAGIPPITIADIATFAPTPGRQLMEPDGWTIAGLDTNFYAITGTHVVNGTLLGRTADVRFTPTSYLWAYGDGTSATKATMGATWASQGIAEFEPTPTSHVYEQLGDYTITLSIVFAAEYRFAGGPWRPVVGTITLPANDLQIRVGTAKTVLVEHDCLANPSGPGC